jgi:hypothetical protein
MMMLLIAGVITGPLGARANPRMEGWIDLYTEHSLAGSTTARKESRSVTESADATMMRGIAINTVCTLHGE